MATTTPDTEIPRRAHKARRPDIILDEKIKLPIADPTNASYKGASATSRNASS